MDRDVRLPLAVLLLLVVVARGGHAEGSKVTHQEGGYQLTIERLHDALPLIDAHVGESVFSYNYNAAFVPWLSAEGTLAGRSLLLRNQMNTTKLKGDGNIYDVSPSVFSLVNFTETATSASNGTNVAFEFDDVTFSDVVFRPETWYETLGTEDPRVVYRAANGWYYLLYSAVQQVEQRNGVSFVNVRLSLATCEDGDPRVWKRRGPLFEDKNGTQWSKSGALLVRDDQQGPHYLFYGDSSYVPGLQVAVSPDLLSYVRLPGVWMPVREDFFDSYLVEAGPMPLLLSDGNYLMIYNSARDGYPSPKPGYDLQYNVGWAVLDGTDPMQILHRSGEPLLSPETAWEEGEHSLTPNVVFCEGWEQTGVDQFILYYGAADTVVGAALLTVTPI